MIEESEMTLSESLTNKKHTVNIMFHVQWVKEKAIPTPLSSYFLSFRKQTLAQKGFKCIQRLLSHGDANVLTK